MALLAFYRVLLFVVFVFNLFSLNKCGLTRRNEIRLQLQRDACNTDLLGHAEYLEEIVQNTSSLYERHFPGQ